MRNFFRILLMGGCVIAFVSAGINFVVSEPTCPDGGEWTKINSNDLSLYPVDGAVEYCFKAGSSNSQGCVGGLFDEWPPDVENYCGLSHWAYRIGDPTETPELPTNTPELPTATNTPEDTPTSTATFTQEPSATPTEDPYETPTETMEATPTLPETSPTSTPNPTVTPRPSPTRCEPVSCGTG